VFDACSSTEDAAYWKTKKGFMKMAVPLLLDIMLERQKSVSSAAKKKEKRDEIGLLSRYFSGLVDCRFVMQFAIFNCSPPNLIFSSI
jgi:hypothetical protein